MPWLATRCATALRSAAGVTISFQEILQRDIVEHRVREHPLELGVLVLQRFQAFGFRHVHAAVFGFPFVDAGVADAMLPAELRDGYARLLSFRIAMICSSLNRLRFMFWSPHTARTNFKLD